MIAAVKRAAPFLEKHLILGGVSLGSYSSITFVELNKTEHRE